MVVENKIGDGFPYFSPLQISSSLDALNLV